VLLFGCLLMLGVHCGARRNGRGALLQIPICHQPQMIGLAEQSAVIEPVYCIRLRFRCPKFDRRVNLPGGFAIFSSFSRIARASRSDLERAPYGLRAVASGNCNCPSSIIRDARTAPFAPAIMRIGQLGVRLVDGLA
jgi:hypothetical protein